MIVVVDAGNSRLKWGLHDGHGWVRRGVVENTNVARLTDDWQDLPSPQKIVVSNVAGAEIKAALELCVQRWHVAPCWVVSQAQASGVTNRYADPSQLGPDRWAALIAAHQVRQACIVVNAGTAVTIDALTKDGIFLGGLRCRLAQRVCKQEADIWKNSLPIPQTPYTAALCRQPQARWSAWRTSWIRQVRKCVP
jgi:type III pantothenate kinase